MRRLTPHRPATRRSTSRQAASPQIAERALGLRVDARADVYALGAILYRLVTGRPPYEGTTADMILDRVVAEAPPALDAANLGIPVDLVTIVNTAMARGARDRQGSARGSAVMGSRRGERSATLPPSP